MILIQILKGDGSLVYRGGRWKAKKHEEGGGLQREKEHIASVIAFTSHPLSYRPLLIHISELHVCSSDFSHLSSPFPLFLRLSPPLIKHFPCLCNFAHSYQGRREGGERSRGKWRREKGTIGLFLPWWWGCTYKMLMSSPTLTPAGQRERTQWKK